jgi:hypothetical protein
MELCLLSHQITSAQINGFRLERGSKARTFALRTTAFAGGEVQRMSYRSQPHLGGRSPNRLEHFNTEARAPNARVRVPLSNRARKAQANERLPFVPPEDWHEPREDGRGYRIVVQRPGEGFRHVLTPDEVRERLSALPKRFLDLLEVVQFSRMTRKKQSFPCYGMQWGASAYLYPIEDNLVEFYSAPPKPNQVNEARMYGGRWVHEAPDVWKLVWTERAVKDFYLNNILIHEVGHLLDDRNSRTIDRERYAEWFAVEYGYKPTRRLWMCQPRAVSRRHAKKRGNGR